MWGNEIFFLYKKKNFNERDLIISFGSKPKIRSYFKIIEEQVSF